MESSFCKACTLPISDGQAYELGADRWHVDCFRCSKCHRQLGVTSNFLVLGTGALVCSECSYACKNCGKKIFDMAILTGDSAYCADCFKCRSCKKPIEDLRYARTSKGLFCMSCHHILMEKKKKYEALKRAKERQKKEIDAARATAAGVGSPLESPVTISQPKLAEDNNRKSSQSSLLRGIDGVQKSSTDSSSVSMGTAKTVNNAISTPSAASAAATASAAAAAAAASVMHPPEILAAESPRSPASASFSAYSAHSAQSPPSAQSAHSAHTPHSVATPSSTTSKHSNRKGVIMDQSMTEQEPESFINLDDDDDGSEEEEKEEEKEEDAKNMKADVREHQTQALGISSDKSGSKLAKPDSLQAPFRAGAGLNIQSLSFGDPAQNTLQVPQAPQTTQQTTQVPRSLPPAVPSSTNTPTPLQSQPHPRRPSHPSRLPSQTSATTPSRKPSAATSSTPIDGVDSESNDFKQSKSPFRFGSTSSPNAHKRVPSAPESPLPSSPNFGSHSRKSSGNANLGRSLSKVFHRHRKTTSNISAHGNGNGSMVYQEENLASTPTTTGTFDSILSSPKANGSLYMGSSQTETTPNHMRTQSEHSTSAYATPPLPSSSGTFHSRSVSGSMEPIKDQPLGQDQAQFSMGGIHREQTLQAERELRLLKAEINSLTSNKAYVLREIQSLQTQKRGLEIEIAEQTAELRGMQAQIKAAEERIKAQQAEQQNYYQQQQQVQDQQVQPSVFANSISSPSSEHLPEVPPKDGSSANGSDNGTTRKSGFMRRFFQNSGQQQNQQSSIPTSISSQSISAPLNVRQGEEALNSMMGHTSRVSPPKQNAELAVNGNGSGNNSGSGNTNNSSGGGFGLVRSRSTNFMRSKQDHNERAAPGVAAATSQPSVPEGIALYGQTLQERSDFEQRAVPYIVSACISYVTKQGIRSEGIYRVSGSAAVIDKMERFFDELPAHDENIAEKTAAALDGDVNAVAGMLKRYLKKIPEPVIPFDMYDSFLEISRMNSDRQKGRALSAILRQLPPSNSEVLHILTAHLNAVAQNEKFTKMTLTTLATVFAPTLTRDNSGNPQREILDNASKTGATEFLLRNAVWADN